MEVQRVIVPLAGACSELLYDVLAGACSEHLYGVPVSEACLADQISLISVCSI